MIYDLIQSLRREATLVSIRVAVPHNGGGCVLMLRHNTFGAREFGAGGAGGGVVGVSLSPTLELRHWCDVTWADSYVAVLDAAWRLGAWDVLRVDYGPDDGSDCTLANAMHSAFVDRPWGVAIDGVPLHAPAEATPEQYVAKACASERGWSGWSFRPNQGNCGAPWFGTRLSGDRTLDADGGRTAVRHIQRRAHRAMPQPGCARRVVYRLGVK